MFRFFYSEWLIEKAKVRKTHNRQSGSRIAKVGATIFFASAHCLFAQAALKVSIDQKSGAYSITAAGIQGPVLSANPSILVDGKWIAGRDYPIHRLQDAPVDGPLGDATEQTVLYSGLAGAPDVHATGLAGSSSEQSNSLTVHGAVSTRYAPDAKRRLTPTTP